MTKKPIIAVDVDDVLAPQNEAMLQHINANFGTKHTKEDYSVEGPYWGYWENIWQVSEEEAKARFDSYHQDGIIRRMAPMVGSIATLTSLKEYYDLIIITARDDSTVDDTHHWLEAHYPKTFSDVHFMHVWSPDRKMSKAAICNEVGAEFLIDDNAEHCRLASENGIKALLFGDYGWNRLEQVPEDVQRVLNWQEVAEYFDGIKK